MTIGKHRLSYRFIKLSAIFLPIVFHPAYPRVIEQCARPLRRTSSLSDLEIPIWQQHFFDIITFFKVG